jgi:hypothetical protein
LLGRKPVAATLRGWPIGYPTTEANLLHGFRESIAAATGRNEQNFCEHLVRELALASPAIQNDPVVRKFLSQWAPVAGAVRTAA